jgi:hypothetical protein
LLLKNEFEPPDFQESIIGRVQLIPPVMTTTSALIPHLATALGAQVTLYSTPATLTALYGSHPVGVVAFVRLRPFGKQR